MCRKLLVIGIFLLTGILWSSAQEVRSLDAIDSILVAIDDSLAADTVIPKVEEPEPSIVVQSAPEEVKTLKDMT